MDDLKKELLTLIDYWVKHNREHGQEFQEWAEKAKPLGNEIAQSLSEAADKMAEANNCLEKARQVLVKSKI